MLEPNKSRPVTFHPCLIQEVKEEVKPKVIKTLEDTYMDLFSL